MPLDPSSRVSRFVQRTAAHPRFARLAPLAIPKLDRMLARATRGRKLVSQWIVPSLVLHSTGSRSGEPRRTPLATIPDGDSFYVVGSNFGKTAHPAWSYNLLAHPEVVVVFRGQRIPVVARLLDADEKAEVWPSLVAIWSTYEIYEARTARSLRVFRLDPR